MQEDENDDFGDLDDGNTSAMREVRDTVGVEGVSLDDYVTADENVVATGVPTDDDIIGSVQPTESTPPTF